jgi:hypothetical protein
MMLGSVPKGTTIGSTVPATSGTPNQWKNSPGGDHRDEHADEHGQDEGPADASTTGGCVIRHPVPRHPVLRSTAGPEQAHGRSTGLLWSRE